MTSADKRKALPGASPGIEPHADVDQAPPAGAIRIRCIDYDQTRFEAVEVDDLDAFLETQTHLRDVHDHLLRVIDMIETYREMAAGLTDLYMSSISNRMNEVMKVLTIMASVFIPITFLAGVYGMNFDHIPELGWRGSYAVFWLSCIGITAGLLLYFRRKGWIGRG